MKTAWLLLAALFGQDKADGARDALREAVKKLKAAPALAFDATVVVTTGRSILKQEAKVVLKRPNLARVETKREVDEVLQVFDGTTAWTYLKSVRQYYRTAQAEGVEAEILGSCPLPKLFYQPEKFDPLSSAEKVSQERETIEGKVYSVVVWTGSGGTHRLWIDPSNRMSRYESRVMSGGQEVRHRVDLLRYRFEPKTDENLFRFDPPKGAKEIQLGANPRDESGLLRAGTKAPPFDAVGPEGKKLSLADYRGKVVLLNFWFYH